MSREAEKPEILIIEDDESYVRRLVGYLSEDYICDTCSCGEDAVGKLDTTAYSAILLDLDLGPGRKDGFEFLEENNKTLIPTPVIVVTRFKEMEKIIKAIRLGAYDYFVKDTEMPALEISLKRAVDWHRLKSEAANLSQKLEAIEGREIIGKDPAFIKILESAKAVAKTDATVLVTGESGTGKWLLAKLIHNMSDRTGPFIDVNCPAIPRTLIESELFGYVRGAFTGAVAAKKGYFEQADGGTLFLDEIGEVDVDYQRKLLKVIEEKSFFRVGDNKPTEVDVRIIAATSSNLEELIEKDQFKRELFYRLNTYGIHIPPLRERPADVIALADYFLVKFARQYGKKINGLTDRAKDYLAMYEWPGNVRELKNIIERAVIMCKTGMITVDYMIILDKGCEEALSYREAKEKCLSDFQRRYMLKMMEKTKGNVAELSRLTGLSRVQCYRLIKEVSGDKVER